LGHNILTFVNAVIKSANPGRNLYRIYYMRRLIPNGTTYLRVILLKCIMIGI